MLNLVRSYLLKFVNRRGFSEVMCAGVSPHAVIEVEVTAN